MLIMIMANGIDVTKYASHPRILEIRVVLMFELIERAFNYETAHKFITAMGEILRINVSRVTSIVNKRTEVKRMRRQNKFRWYQEVIFMCHLYGETRYFASKEHLRISTATLYNRDLELHVDQFVNERWLNELDKEIILCGIPDYSLEAERYVTQVDGFFKALGYVSAPKK